MCMQRSLLLRVACPARYAMQRPPVFHNGKRMTSLGARQWILGIKWEAVPPQHLDASLQNFAASRMHRLGVYDLQLNRAAHVRLL